MRVDVKCAGIVMAATLLVSCASEPKQPAPAPQPQAPLATQPNADAQPDITPEVSRTLLRQGYEAVKVKDQIVYCRAETVTGTKFKKKVCLTDTAIADLERKTKETQNEMLKGRTNPGCMPPNCG
jgi:hypothetical protein